MGKTSTNKSYAYSSCSVQIHCSKAFLQPWRCSPALSLLDRPHVVLSAGCVSIPLMSYVYSIV